MKNFDKNKYPNCHKGHQYAKDVIAGKILASIYTISACKRYLNDIQRTDLFFDLDWAEKFMRMFQNFEHSSGVWKSKNIILEPWQCFFFLNMEGFYWKRTKKRKYKEAYLEVARGNGKALCLNTIIPTPSGPKKLKELTIGDVVFDREGRQCSIIAETEVHTPDQYEITFNQGAKVRASADHLWFTKNKLEKKRKKNYFGKKNLRKDAILVFESTRTTKEIKDTLRVGGKQECNHSITIAKPVNIKKTDQILNPWFLGYWIGNGNKSTSVISFNLDDHADMARILKEQGISHSDVKMKAGTEKGAHFYIYGITALLRELGVIGNKKIPNHYLNGSRQQRLELLQGLLDSDGWISTPDKNGKKSSRVSFDTVKKDLAMDVLYLVNSLGFKGTLLKKKIPENNNYKTKNKFSYSVNFTPVDDVPVFKLTRKRLRQRYENTASAFTYVKDHYIKDISLPRKKVPMKCIQVDSPDGSFLCTEYFIPTHNSSVLSVTGLIYLSLYKVVVGNKVYAASTKKDQSRIILDAARIMAKKNTSYLRHTGTKVYAHHIAHEASGSEFRALSSDSNGLDGLLPLISIVDELHAHKTREIYDVMASAMSKRADSILVCITTAGFSLEGIGYSQSQYAKKVALGDIGDEAFFSLVYTLDEDDDWTDSKNWIKSNPNLGVSVDVEGLSSKAFKAINNPQDEVNFKVKHLNLWQNAAHQFFNVKKWNELANPNLKIEDFKNDPCYIGIDLASKIDLTSFAYVFKNKETEKYTVFVDNFIPKATLEESRNVFYKTWADKGHLIATEGNAVNLPKLQTDFVEKAKKYSVQAAHFDPWNATEFAQRMSMEHIEMLEFKMSTSNMSEPMKKLDALIREGRVEHNGNPLVAWCLGNVVAKVDANDNVFPRKEHESMKIDPIVAILMALAGWVKLENERSVYEERGLIIF